MTLSNAMDVGNPSNFARMLELYSSTWNKMTEDIEGYAFTDIETEGAMREVFNKYNYILDPHGAVGFLAFKEYQKKNNAQGIILETAHPAKFLDDVERILNKKLPIPERLAALADRKKVALTHDIEFESLKNWLINNY
jgi:threonine synthase